MDQYYYNHNKNISKVKTIILASYSEIRKRLLNHTNIPKNINSELIVNNYNLEEILEKCKILSMNDIDKEKKYY
jgi:hypothetical protein